MMDFTVILTSASHLHGIMRGPLLLRHTKLSFVIFRQRLQVTQQKLDATMAAEQQA